MTKTRIAIYLALLLAWPLHVFAEIAFRHRFISSDLGTACWSQLAIADMDNDGKPDVIVGECQWRNEKPGIYWFKNNGRGDAWGPKKLLGEDVKTDSAIAITDVDRDGWMDIVSSHQWYRSPGAQGGIFERFVYDAETLGRPRAHAHDVMVADLDADGRVEIVAIGNGGFYLYRIPADPRGPWRRTEIAPVGGKHAAIFPHGIADINGDGAPDIVYLDRWFENVAGKAIQWEAHNNIPFGSKGPWGVAGRTWVADLDKDGRADIVQSDCDVAKAKLVLFRNTRGEGSEWEPLVLPDDQAPGDFHSLIVADFDGDGDLDIHVDEVEHIHLPEGREAKPGRYVWENLDGKGLRWKKHAIHTGLGGHQAVAVDIDGDGDIDIVTKSFQAGKANGGRPHLSLMENLSR